jgi:hypothetical protein
MKKVIALVAVALFASNANAFDLISLTVNGIIRSNNPLPKNDSSPIIKSAVDGISNDVNELHPLNVAVGIVSYGDFQVT